MARPRSLSRSTTVVASGAGKLRKKEKWKAKVKTDNGGAVASETWDYDDSESDDANTKENTSREDGISAVHSKKRLRTNSDRADRASEVRTRIEDEDETESSPTFSLKRPRPTKGDATTSDELGHSDTGEASDDEEPRQQASHDEEDDVLSDVREEEEGMVLSTEAENDKGGGMGEVMARILEQKVDSRNKAPVLAKRKTKAMREMEDASIKSAEARSKSAARRANMTQQFVVPDHTTTDYERQLKKIATRGVVALFNAISKRQREGATGKDDGAKGAKKAGAVKGASKHAFLDMLKNGVKPLSKAAGADKGPAEARTGVGAKGGTGAFDDDHAEETRGGKPWTVFKDDYMLGSNSMKNWDKQSEESEPDELEHSAMSGDDSE